MAAATTQVIDRPHTPTIDIQALLDSRQATPGEFQTKSIEVLQKTLGELVTELDPQDTVRPFDQCKVRYYGEKIGWSFRNEDASWTTPMTMTHRAFRQAGSKVLGQGGLDFAERTRQTGPSGSDLATINWMYHLGQSESRGLFRSMKFPGERYRTIRGVLSGSDRGFMTNLDNMDVVNLLAESASFRELPIIDWKITPDTMRIRFLLDPADSALFDANGRLLNPGNSHDTSLKIPVPMGEILNGEVGNHAVIFTDALWTFACLNGMVSHGGKDNSNSFTRRWAHVGGNDRGEKIQAAIGDSIKSARIAANGQVEAFKAATTVAISDAFALLDHIGRKEGHITRAQAQRAATAINDETSYPGRNLAAVISGVTLAAQSETDIDRQREMERFASRLMAKGLQMGHATGAIVIPEA